MKLSIAHAAKVSQGARIAASSELGTTYYSASLSDVKEAFRREDTNIWLAYLIESKGFDALNIQDAMHGSAIVDDVLYICVTDGKDISINGEAVDPVTALKHHSPDELSQYIEPASRKFITGSISEYEVIFDDIDSLAEEMMKAGYTFTELMDSAMSMNMLGK